MGQSKRALIISCFDTWYYNRIEPISEILKDKGYKVKIIVSDYHHIKKEYITDQSDKCTYAHVPRYKKNLSAARIISHLKFGASVYNFIKCYIPDLIYLIMPPNNTAVYCNRYKRMHPNCIYIIDIIDLWPESMPMGRRFSHILPALVWKKLRDDSLETADHVFTECKLYQKKLRNVLDPNRTSTLYLYKEQSEEEQELVERIIFEKENEIANIKRKRISFAYLGSINSIIDIDGICDVLNKFHRNGVLTTIEVVGDGKSRDKFLDSLCGTGSEVHYHGAVYDEMEKIRILASCDFAFNMMKDTVSVGLTIKSIDYISYGLPLINNIKGDTWKLVEKYGIGVNTDENPMKIMTVEHKNVNKVYVRQFSKDVFKCSVKTVFAEIGL